MKQCTLLIFFCLALPARAENGSMHGVHNASAACDEDLKGPKVAPNDVPESVWSLDAVKNHPGLHANFVKSRHIPIWGDWARAAQKLKRIQAAADASDPEERKEWQKIARLAEAAVTKHHLVFMRDQHPEDLRVGNHLAVLRAIAEFDVATPLLSLYRIQREIERIHSTKEYLNCR